MTRLSLTWPGKEDMPLGWKRTTLAPCSGIRHRIRLWIRFCMVLGLLTNTLAAMDPPHVFRSVSEALAAHEPVRVLDLSGQRLTKIPKEVWRMRELEELYLNDNQLLDLPRRIGQLRRLKVLDIAHNPLTELPPQLCRLSRLESIRLAGCPVASPPPCIDKLPRLIRYELQVPMPDSQRRTLDSVFSQGDMFIFATAEPVPLNSQTIARQARQAAPACRDEHMSLRIFVSQEGYYLRHRVLSGAGTCLLPQIEALLPQLAFRPAYEGNEPVSFWVNVAF